MHNNSTNPPSDPHVGALPATSTSLSRPKAHWLAPLRLARFVDLLGYFLFLSGLITMCSALNLLRAGYSSVPFWDEIDEVGRYFNSLHGSPLAWIWEQHNEHRIIFYKLLLIFDLKVAAGRNWPIYVGIFLCQVSLVVIFGYAVLTLARIDCSTWRACMGIALYCMFCVSQWENFFWAFQLPFVMVSVLVVAAIMGVCLQKARVERQQSVSGKLLAISLVAATGATFTNGNGITAWPAMIAVALVASLPWRLVGSYVLGFLTVAPLYMIGYQSPIHHANPLTSMKEPLSVLIFVESYLGSSVVPNIHIDWAAQIGQLALIVVVVLMFQLVKRRGRANVIDYFLSGIIMYVVATAVVTALGRLNFGVGQAFAPRYQSFSLLFWLALVTWIILTAYRKRATKTIAALYLSTVLVMCLSVRYYPPILEDIKTRIMEREVGGIAMVVGIHDNEYFKTAILPFPVNWPALDYLRERHLSVYSAPMAGELGKEFRQAYTVDPSETCVGNVDMISHPSGSMREVRLDGWIIDRQTRRPQRTLVFVAGGKIVGYGISGRLRPDVVNATHSRRTLHSGWSGYAKLPSSGMELEVYGIMNSSGGREVCHLETVPPSEPVP